MSESLKCKPLFYKIYPLLHWRTVCFFKTLARNITTHRSRPEACVVISVQILKIKYLFPDEIGALHGLGRAGLSLVDTIRISKSIETLKLFSQLSARFPLNGRIREIYYTTWLISFKVSIRFEIRIVSTIERPALYSPYNVLYSFPGTNMAERRYPICAFRRVGARVRPASPASPRPANRPCSRPSLRNPPNEYISNMLWWFEYISNMLWWFEYMSNMLWWYSDKICFVVWGFRAGSLGYRVYGIGCRVTP